AVGGELAPAFGPAIEPEPEPQRVGPETEQRQAGTGRLRAWLAGEREVGHADERIGIDLDLTRRQPGVAATGGAHPAVPAARPAALAAADALVVMAAAGAALRRGGGNEAARLVAGDRSGEPGGHAECEGDQRRGRQSSHTVSPSTSASRRTSRESACLRRS